MKKLRPLLFIPLGVYEILLLLIAGVLAAMSKIGELCVPIVYHADKLPGLKWYFEGYKK